MLDSLLALHEILTLMATNQVREAGQVAEARLGKGAMGKNARLPFEAPPVRRCPLQCMRLVAMVTLPPASLPVPP